MRVTDKITMLHLFLSIYKRCKSWVGYLFMRTVTRGTGGGGAAVEGPTRREEEENGGGTTEEGDGAGQNQGGAGDREAVRKTAGGGAWVGGAFRLSICQPRTIFVSSVMGWHLDQLSCGRGLSVCIG